MDALIELSKHPLACQAIPAMSDESIAKVAALEAAFLKQPQVALETKHVFHGGMYARSLQLRAGFRITGALIKIPTLLIICGNVLVYIGDKAIELDGYNVLSAAANRKQAFVAKSDVDMTMIFPTQATTVEEAEKEFTNQFAELLSHTNKNTVEMGET